MKQTIVLNERVFEYELQRKNVKNINLRIQGNGAMTLSVNASVSMVQIEAFFNSKCEAIYKTLQKLAVKDGSTPTPHRYVAGEGFGLLGETLPLVVVQGKTNRAFVKDGQLMCTITDRACVANTDKIEAVVKEWQKEQLFIVLETICKEVYAQFALKGVVYPQIKVRDMVSCWGNCRPTKGILTFNIWLIEAPMSCITYVVLHEFSHFIYPNHSKDFYQLLSALLPQWRQQKQMLLAMTPRMCLPLHDDE